MTRLRFKKKLGEASGSALVGLLKDLHAELKEHVQEGFETKSLEGVKNELLGHLFSRNSGVKVYVGVCLVDIYRLYAPEEAYEGGEKQSTLEFLIKQLKPFSDPNDGHRIERQYILDSLVNVQTIVALTELDDAETLAAHLFDTAFAIADAQNDLDHALLLTLADLLSLVLNALDIVPLRLVEILIKPLERKNRGASHDLAGRVLEESSVALQRPLGQLLGKQLHKAKEESTQSKSEVLKRAHMLFQTIASIAPVCLLSAASLLDDALSSSSTTEELTLAVHSLGVLFSSSAELPHGELPRVWRAWLRSAYSRTASVRLVFSARLGRVWRAHPDLSSEIEPVVVSLLADTDERVRSAACGVFGDVSHDMMVHGVAQDTIQALSERMKDRKPTVALCASETLGRWYSVAPESFRWFPGALLDVLRYGDATRSFFLRRLVRQTFFKSILPFPTEESAESWSARVVNVASELNEAQLALFLSIGNLRGWDMGQRLCEAHGAYLGASKEEGEAKVKLQSLLLSLATQTASGKNIQDALWRVCEGGGQDVGVAFGELSKAETGWEELKKIRKMLVAGGEDVEAAVDDILERYGPVLVNKDVLRTLYGRLDMEQEKEGEQQEEGEEQNRNATQLSATAATILRHVAKNRAQLFLDQVALYEDGLSSPHKVELSVYILSRVVRDESCSTYKPQKDILDRLEFLVTSEGEHSVRTRKYAATVLAVSNERVSSIVASLMAEISSETPLGELAEPLAALARVWRYAESLDVAADNYEVVRRLFLRESEADEERFVELNGDVTWAPAELQSASTLARVSCLKALAGIVMKKGERTKVEEEENKESESLLKLLIGVIENEREEEKKEENDTRLLPELSSPTQVFLRLHASVLLLKLASFPFLRSQLNSRFASLAQMVQDSCYEVCFGFVERLLRELRSNPRFPPRYRVALYLAAYDPEQEIIDSIKLYIQDEVARLSPVARQAQFEHTFFRLLHLLAHHPDFYGDAQDEDDIQFVARYIDFFLDCIATPDNVSYLFSIASMVKSVEDKQSEDSSRLYILSEVAQYLIRNRSKAKGWPLSAFTGKILLPGDLFKFFASAQERSTVQKTQFVSESVLETLLIKRHTSKRRKVTSKRKKVRVVSSASSSENDSEVSTHIKRKKTPPREEPTRHVPSRQARPSRKKLIESDDSEGEEDFAISSAPESEKENVAVASRSNRVF